jgi:hypothetical protein
MDDFAHVQTEMQASIDSQISVMHNLLQRFKLRGGAGCLGLSSHLCHFVPSFSSYLITCLAHRITTIVMTVSK